MVEFILMTYKIIVHLKKCKMKKFDFYLDQKVTTWMRTHFEVDAESDELAWQKAKDMVNNGDTDSIPWDEITDTQEQLCVEDNDGFSTQELYTNDGELVYSNGKS